MAVVAIPVIIYMTALAYAVETLRSRRAGEPSRSAASRDQG
jgi:hypothetical protein